MSAAPTRWAASAAAMSGNGMTVKCTCAGVTPAWASTLSVTGCGAPDGAFTAIVAPFSWASLVMGECEPTTISSRPTPPELPGPIARSPIPRAATASAEVHWPSDTSTLPLIRSGITSAALTDDSIVTCSPAAANNPRCSAMYRPAAPVAGTAATTMLESAGWAVWVAVDGELHPAADTAAAAAATANSRRTGGRQRGDRRLPSVIRGRSFISLVLFSGYAKWSASEPQANIGQVHPVFPAVPTGRWRPDGAVRSAPNCVARRRPHWPPVPGISICHLSFRSSRTVGDFYRITTADLPLGFRGYKGRGLPRPGRRSRIHAGLDGQANAFMTAAHVAADQRIKAGKATAPPGSVSAPGVRVIDRKSCGSGK